MIIKEIKAKSILSKSGIYGIDYSINPYNGCAHGCTYCYARFVFIHKNIDPRDWGKIVFVKINASELLRREIRNAERGSILLSSVTDPYQFLERKYELTRRILEIILRKQFPVVILTKSPLVTRDIDLFKEFRNIEVGITITTLSEDIKKIFEPKAPSIKSRLLALKEIVDSGIRNYAFIAPLLPIMSISEIESLLQELKEIKVDRVMVDKLNIKAKNWLTINKALDMHSSVKKEEFWMKTKSQEYWIGMKRELIKLSKKLSINIDILF